MYTYMNSKLLSGLHIGQGFGHLETSPDQVDFQVIRDIICQGHHHGAVVYVIRQAFSPEVSCRLVDNFDTLLEETRGGNRSYDGFVMTQQIGASQFSRSTPDYIKEVIRHSERQWELFNGVSDDELESLFLTGYLEREFARSGVHFGFSRYKGLPGAFATFRRWLDNGCMALMPHEDVAQLKQARRDRFEIGRAQRVISFNACIESPQAGGNLTVWNLQPDDDCRERYGVMETGYPYTVDDLRELQKIELQLDSGDVYFMNASHLHGVTTLTAGRRLTAGRFIGEVRPDKVVFWT